MDKMHSPRLRVFLILPATISLLGLASPSYAAAVSLYDAFNYGPTTKSPLWTAVTGKVGSVQFDGVAYLRQPGGQVAGLATIQAPSLSQRFLKTGDTFRLTFDLIMLDFGSGNGDYGFGLMNVKSSTSLWAGYHMEGGRITLRTGSAMANLETAALHLDWELKAINIEGALDVSLAAYSLNPLWASTPELYTTQSKPVATIKSRSSVTLGATVPLIGFCGSTAYFGDPYTADRGSMAIDNVYVQSAPEPTSAALAVTGALALLGRRRRGSNGLRSE
jgi:MYXO-CTERM domain-containing protein